MIYRKAQPQDFELILGLQQQNLLSSLPEGKRSNGFLSTAYTLEDFKGMHNSIGIAVCMEGETLCGYFCASTPSFIHSFRHPFPKTMIEHCGTLFYRDKPLTHYRFFVGNPACIAEAYRGMNILAGLVDTACQMATPIADVGITFISTQNQRSLQAIQKLNLEVIGHFETHGQAFHILLKPLSV